MKIFANDLFCKEIDRVNMTFSTAAFAELDNKWTADKMVAPYTRIYLVTDGEGSITYDGKTVKLTPGNVYILPAGMDFSCECHEHMCKIFFHVNVLRYNNYDILEGCKKCIVLKGRKEDIAHITRLLKNDTVNSVLLVKSKILNLLVQAIEQEGIELGKIEQYSKNVKAAISIIDKNLRANLRISYIAGSLYISESRLQKDFRREVGVSIGKYINDRIMSRSQMLVSDPELSVKEISDILGFCDQFYFSRKFTQYYGVSPLVYRKAIL
ncbi:MAG: AraC family transcriptional regulator [Oscillospiraceae bacterium]|nr:AraC family transcriptional regulator [Oscillospiraceae bacterium]